MWGGSRHISDLFCGELVHYIQCIDVDYRRENRERFYDLQLPILPTLGESLEAYASETCLDGDNKFRTDDFGLQDARKGLRMSHLPPVLMLQLKRFQFNYFTESNEKILDVCRYP